MQCARHVFLVRPASFFFNTETSLTNSFQAVPPEEADLLDKALAEFDEAVCDLRGAGIDVTVFNDTAIPPKPDAVFPNNWISLHANGMMVLYPMCAPNRRTERRQDIVQQLSDAFRLMNTIDLSAFEREGRFLEGTGSIVFDHAHKAAFACLSARTDLGLLEQLCAQLGYKPVSFLALDAQGGAIYHTNVMMCVGLSFAVICLDAIPNAKEKSAVVCSLESAGKEIIPISHGQMARFAGNMLELQTCEGKQLAVLSKSALESLNAGQRKAIARHAGLLALNIPTIETVGGGSARCMIAEIFLPPK